MMRYLFQAKVEEKMLNSVDPVKVVKDFFGDMDTHIIEMEEIQRKSINPQKIKDVINMKTDIAFLNNLEEYDPQRDTLIIYDVQTINNRRYKVGVYDPFELFDNPEVLFCVNSE